MTGVLTDKHRARIDQAIERTDLPSELPHDSAGWQKRMLAAAKRITLGQGQLDKMDRLALEEGRYAVDKLRATADKQIRVLRDNPDADNVAWAGARAARDATDRALLAFYAVRLAVEIRHDAAQKAPGRPTEEYIRGLSPADLLGGKDNAVFALLRLPS